MGRDEYLAREIMGWTRSKTFSDEWKWFAPDGWAEYALDEWNPGKSWPQTGMIIEAMKEGFQLRVQEEIARQGKIHYYVTFIGANEHYGTATEIDLREAIATAAARAKGWEDGDES